MGDGRVTNRRLSRVRVPVLIVAIVILAAASAGAQHRSGLDNGEIVVAGSAWRGPWGTPYLSVNEKVVGKLFADRLHISDNLDFGLEFLSRPGESSGFPYDKRVYFDFRPVIVQDAYHSLFLEFHGRRKFRRLFAGRRDNAVGLGYRRIFFERVLFGVNAFADISRTRRASNNSWGWGVEAALRPLSNCVLDFTLNNYGNPFNAGRLAGRALDPANADWDSEIGCTLRGLLNKFNLRLKADAYGFRSGRARRMGRSVGLDLSVAEGGAFVACELGRDDIRGDYRAVLAGIRIPFQPDLILENKSPLEFPLFPSVGAGKVTLREWLSRQVPRNSIGKPTWR
jgi:hypothetical protein